jgi:hypothetical protein
MTRTVVGLFEDQTLANQVACELKAAGVPSGEIQVLVDPLDLPVRGLLSTPHTDFMAFLCRELREIGATEEEAEVYIQGVQKGGALILATGPADKVEAAAAIMNRNNARDVEELAGLEPALPAAAHISGGATRSGSVLTGRIRQSGDGARIFVW